MVRFEMRRPSVVVSMCVVTTIAFSTPAYLFPAKIQHANEILTNVSQYDSVLISIYMAVVIFLRSTSTDDPLLRGIRKRLSTSIFVLAGQAVFAFACACLALEFYQFQGIAYGTAISESIVTALILGSLGVGDA